ncbi:hypothetical protein KCU85_g21, partial [Aureobasidium melanogenum]
MFKYWSVFQRHHGVIGLPGFAEIWIVFNFNLFTSMQASTLSCLEDGGISAEDTSCLEIMVKGSPNRGKSRSVAPTHRARTFREESQKQTIIYAAVAFIENFCRLPRQQQARL